MDADCRTFTNLGAFPWLNIGPGAFNPSQLAFNGLGCAVWVVAYAALAYAIFKKKFVEMPVIAAGANIVWELIWSLWFCPTTGRAFWLMYLMAFVIDIFICAAVLRYGAKQFRRVSAGGLGPAVGSGWWSQRVKPLFAINLVVWSAIIAIWELSPLHDPIGANSGYLLNLLLSVLCLEMFLRLNSPHLFSKVIGLSRTVGTALISVSIISIYPRSPLLIATTIACFLVDTTYVVLLFRRHVPWL